MHELPLTVESDLARHRGTWRRRIILILLATVCVMILLCAGVGWWWWSRPDFGDTVRAAGGRYRFGDMSTPLGRFSDWINDRQTYVYHIIEFAPGNVDDAWLERNQAEIREQTNLSLSLHNTRVTGRGLSHLDGAENLKALSLRGTRLTDAAMSEIIGLPYVSSLDVAETGISDEAVAGVARMPWLAGITIDSSQTTPVAIAGLAQCPRLGSVVIVDANDDSVEQVTQLNGLVGLVLFGDNVTTASLPALKQLQGLQVLTFWDSNLTEDDLFELQQALPGCVVQKPDSELLERMREEGWE